MRRIFSRCDASSRIASNDAAGPRWVLLPQTSQTAMDRALLASQGSATLSCRTALHEHRRLGAVPLAVGASARSRAA